MMESINQAMGFRTNDFMGIFCETQWDIHSSKMGHRPELLKIGISFGNELVDGMGQHIY